MKMYNEFARAYDCLSKDTNYNEFVSFIDQLIHINKDPIKNKDLHLLDLACGNGNITIGLRQQGYKVMGSDISVEMLTIAQQKATQNNCDDILFVCQDMREFYLYNKVDAVVCCLDSINYLTKISDVSECFASVYGNLKEDGLFIFDINSEYKFQNILADNVFLYDTQDYYCVWENLYNEKSKICDFYLTFFERTETGSKYKRFDEHHKEKAYSVKQISNALKKTGFKEVCTYAPFVLEAPKVDSERLFFVAKR